MRKNQVSGSIEGKKESPFQILYENLRQPNRFQLEATGPANQRHQILNKYMNPDWKKRKIGKYSISGRRFERDGFARSRREEFNSKLPNWNSQLIFNDLYTTFISPSDVTFPKLQVSNKNPSILYGNRFEENGLLQKESDNLSSFKRKRNKFATDPFAKLNKKDKRNRTLDNSEGKIRSKKNFPLWWKENRNMELLESQLSPQSQETQGFNEKYPNKEQLRISNENMWPLQSIPQVKEMFNVNYGPSEYNEKANVQDTETGNAELKNNFLKQNPVIANPALQISNSLFKNEALLRQQPQKDSPGNNFKDEQNIPDFNDDYRIQDDDLKGNLPIRNGEIPFDFDNERQKTDKLEQSMNYKDQSWNNERKISQELLETKSRALLQNGNERNFMEAMQNKENKFDPKTENAEDVYKVDHQHMDDNYHKDMDDNKMQNENKDQNEPQNEGYVSSDERSKFQIHSFEPKTYEDDSDYLVNENLHPIEKKPQTDNKKGNGDNSHSWPAPLEPPPLKNNDASEFPLLKESKQTGECFTVGQVGIAVLLAFALFFVLYAVILLCWRCCTTRRGRGGGDFHPHSWWMSEMPPISCTSVQKNTSASHKAKKHPHNSEELKIDSLQSRYYHRTGK